MNNSSFSYIGIADDYKKDKVVVWERDDHFGNRIRKEYDSPRYFFIPDDEGDFTSMYGHKLKKLSFDNKDDFDHAKRVHKFNFESDVSPNARVLMDYYYNKPIPKLNYAFIDIESEIIKGTPFSRPSNPHAPINAFTLYRQWENKFYAVAVPPPEWEHGLDSFPIDIKQYDTKFIDIDVELLLVNSESELLYILLELLEECDFISGWNSEFYDLPYIYKRIEKVLGEQQTSKLNFPNSGKPRERFVEKFGKQELVIELKGRSHLDYKDMFEKFTFEGRESFRLEAISIEELGVKKLDHEGLRELYYKDFIKFVHYNIVDVVLIAMLDLKFKFVQLVNQMAHENTVPFAAILGTTRYVDTGIMNYAINNLNLRVKNKQLSENDKVEGAIVLTPRVGLHEWVGSVDINSLYPSAIRSLNMSPEKVIGQFNTEQTKDRVSSNTVIAKILKRSEMKGADCGSFIEATSKELDWHSIMIDEDEEPHTLWFEDGENLTLTGKQWKEIFVEKQWAISAYGTVFDQSAGKGIVPQVLEFWYTERKRLQKEKKQWSEKLQELKKTNNLGDEYLEAKYQEEHFDLLQLTKKIQLNSAYGALLAKGFRWSVRELLGASTTYCGRAITSHMCAMICKTMSGQYLKPIKSYDVNPKGEIQNIYTSPTDELIYSDTDSGYFKTLAENKEEAVVIADGIAEIINESFPEFMRKAFNCQPGFDLLIAAGREVVAERGLFQARKKYVLKVVDLEGFATNKLKAMGSEIKKSDTPKVIQQFLKKTVSKILDGESYSELEKFVNDERVRLFNKDIDEDDKLLFGVAKASNNLEHFTKAYEMELAGTPMKNSKGTGKLTIPGHCRAAIHYNLMALEKEGNDAELISSGDKVKVFDLKPNENQFETIAIPAEADTFPNWFFEEFDINIKTMEEKLITSKLESVFSAWGQEVPTLFKAKVNRVLVFE